jgi:hypothetical protein
MIISLVLMLILGVQSCAVAVGGSLAEDLSTAASEKEEASNIAGAGACGMLAAFLWLIAAAFVLNRPRTSMKLFIAAAVFCLIGAVAGFTDLWFWMVASLVFAWMSRRGDAEKSEKEAEERAKYDADVRAAAAAQATQLPPPPEAG